LQIIKYNEMIIEIKVLYVFFVVSMVQYLIISYFFINYLSQS